MSDFLAFRNIHCRKVRIAKGYHIIFCSHCIGTNSNGVRTRSTFATIIGIVFIRSVNAANILYLFSRNSIMVINSICYFYKSIVVSIVIMVFCNGWSLAIIINTSTDSFLSPCYRISGNIT